MDKKTTAVFIGHRDCFELRVEDICPKIEEAIRMGINTFLNGGQGYFDKLCAQAVYSLKEKYPFIKSILVAPYLSLKIEDDSLFDEITLFAPVSYIEQIGYKRAIPQRNEFMIENSSVAISYVNHASTGSFKTMQKAKEHGLSIISVLFSR